MSERDEGVRARGTEVGERESEKERATERERERERVRARERGRECETLVRNDECVKRGTKVGGRARESAVVCLTLLCL